MVLIHISERPSVWIYFTELKLHKYLATINRLDKDGDVLYGSTGYYAETPLEAAYNAAEYYDKSWDDDMILPEELFIEIQEFYEEQIL